MACKLTGEQLLGAVRSICQALKKDDAETILLVTQGLANAQKCGTCHPIPEVSPEVKNKNYQGSAPIPNGNMNVSKPVPAKNGHSKPAPMKSFKDIVGSSNDDSAPETPKSETKAVKPVKSASKSYPVTGGGWLKAISELCDGPADPIHITFEGHGKTKTIRVEKELAKKFAELYDGGKIDRKKYNLSDDDWNGVTLMKITNTDYPMFASIDARKEMFGKCKNADLDDNELDVECLKYVMMSRPYYDKKTGHRDYSNYRWDKPQYNNQLCYQCFSGNYWNHSE